MSTHQEAADFKNPTPSCRQCCKEIKHYRIIMQSLRRNNFLGRCIVISKSKSLEKSTRHIPDIAIALVCMTVSQHNCAWRACLAPHATASPTLPILYFCLAARCHLHTFYLTDFFDFNFFAIWERKS